MMVKFRLIGAAVVAGLVAVLMAGCGGTRVDKAGDPAGRAPLVLTLANPLGSSEELDGFTHEVAQLSGGTIRIEVRNRWRYGQASFETGLIGDVRAGKADLGVAGSRAWDSVGVTSLRALGAPLLINSYALEERVIRSPLTAQMLDGLAPLGLVGLGVLPGPLRYPLGIAKPLSGPGSYAGLKIGVQEWKVGSDTFRALGSTPVWLGAGAPITGLDGTEVAIYTVEGNHYGGPGEYLTANVVLWPRPLVIFAGRAALAKLTVAERRIISRAIQDDLAPETSVMSNEQLVATENLCRSRQMRFVLATGVDLASLRRAVQPVYASLERNPQTRKQIMQIQLMRAGIAPEPPPSCRSAVPSASATRLLDGVYQFTSTPADLTAAGAQPNELVPENYGAWTVVIDRGRFALTQRSSTACTWAYGRITIKGSTLQLLVSNGGGVAPTGALDKPGELWAYRWSLYRGTLTLRGVAGAVSPAPTMAKVWQLVSATPSSRFFSRICPPPANALGG